MLATIADVPPSNPIHGQLWWESDTGNMFIYVTDANSSQWVQVNSTTYQQSDLTVSGGRFEYVSATQCKLIPFKGNGIRIAGTVYPIPAAGVTVSNSGLSADTTYFAYAYINTSGGISIQFSVGAHSPDTVDGNIGVEVRTSDRSRTLVGIVRTNASAQFEYTPNLMHVRSWYNRGSEGLYSNPAGSSVAAPTTMAEVHTNLRMSWVNWASEEVTFDYVIGYYSSALATLTYNMKDNTGTAWGYGIAINMVSTSSQVLVTGHAFSAAWIEGHHYITLHQVTSALGPATYSATYGHGRLSE
jgi:hypothetical protein